MARFINDLFQYVWKPHNFCVLLLFVRGDGRSNLTGYYYIVQFTLFLQILLHRKHQQWHIWVNFHSLLIFFCSFSMRFKVDRCLLHFSICKHECDEFHTSSKRKLTWQPPPSQQELLLLCLVPARCLRSNQTHEAFRAKGVLANSVSVPLKDLRYTVL